MTMCKEETPFAVRVEEEKSQECDSGDEGLEAVLVQTTKTNRMKLKSVLKSIGKSSSSSASSTRVVLSSCVFDTNEETKDDVADREPVEEQPVARKEDAGSREQEAEKNETKKPKTKTVWRSYMDPNTNRVYYYNKETRETSWERPQGVRIKDLTNKRAKTEEKKEETEEEGEKQAKKAKTAAKVNSNFREKKAGLTVFALGRDRTMEEQDTKPKVTEEKIEEDEEIDVDDVELDIEGSAMTSDGEVLFKKTPKRKKGLRMKHLSMFKSRSKVAVLHPVVEEDNESATTGVSPASACL